MKKALSIALAAIIALGAFSALAATSTAKVAPRLESVEYKGHGAVEVDFRRDVRYKTSASVKITSENDTEYEAEILKKDDDDLTFSAEGLTSGKYSFKISGVRVRGYSTYYTVKGSFTVPQAAELGDSGIELDEVDYDYDDRELSVDFMNRVQWKSPKATVTDADGKTFTATITERDSDDCEIRVRGLTYGEEYTLKLSGIRAYGEKSYTTITIPFIAIDD